MAQFANDTKRCFSLQQAVQILIITRQPIDFTRSKQMVLRFIDFFQMWAQKNYSDVKVIR